MRTSFVFLSIALAIVCLSSIVTAQEGAFFPVKYDKVVHEAALQKAKMALIG